MSSRGTRWLILATVAIACAVYLSLRSESVPEVVQDPPPAKPTKDIPEPLPISWSTIKGRVVWLGPVPERREIDFRDPQTVVCRQAFKDSLEVNLKNRGVKNAVVFLAGHHRNQFRRRPPPMHPSLRQAPTAEVMFDVKDYRVTPRVLALREGQTLVGRTNKETHAIDFSNNFEARGRMLSDLTTPRLRWTPNSYSEPWRITCDIHYWMKGYVWVFDHPYYAVTDEDGAFDIPLAPCGDRRLFVWHEAIDGVVSPDGNMIDIKESRENDLGEIGIRDPGEKDGSGPPGS